MLEISNCYKILHLEEDCSDLELRQQYRKFALQWHPDKIKMREFPQEHKDECFMRISQAYNSIVSHRKANKKPRRHLVSQLQIQNKRTTSAFSLDQIRKKLADINLLLFPKLESKEPSSNSLFTTEVNRLYDEHMSVIDNLSQRLKKMREH